MDAPVPHSPAEPRSESPAQTWPFHADERAAQARAGVTAPGGGIRTSMPEQHRIFFGELTFLFAAVADDSGWPLATMLTGQRGFISAPDPVTLEIAGRRPDDDPAAAHFRAGGEIGLLGIDFAARRRNRANGKITAADETGLRVAVRQSFGNCPQYIQRRAPDTAQPLAAIRSAHVAEPLALLDHSARQLIATADTFFVASASRPGQGATGGLDVSHRGGRPGFVRIDGDTLVIPDFSGNRYFNTLGNLSGEPRAALLFIDFERGDLLQLQGMAEIDWSGAAGSLIDGAERSWRFHVARGWRRRGASPLHWTFIDYSPVTLRTGTWPPKAAPE